MNLKNLVLAVHNDEEAATATEYIILLILIACMVILIVKAFGTTVMDKFDTANKDVQKNVDFSGRKTG